MIIFLFSINFNKYIVQNCSYIILCLIFEYLVIDSTFNACTKYKIYCLNHSKNNMTINLVK